MKNKKALIVVVIFLFVILIAAAAFSILKAFRKVNSTNSPTAITSGSGMLSEDVPSANPDTTDGTNTSSEQTGLPGKDSESGPDNDSGEDVLPDWVPFVVDSSQESPLEGFLYESSPVQPAAALEMAESGDKEAIILAKVKEKAPDYPFDKIPLLQPDMLVTGSQGAFGDDAAVDILYYPLSTPDEALDFYRKALGQYERFKEEVYESSAGNSYSLSFTIPGEYTMNASVMVMEMPQTTGYSCAVNIHIAIRGINKEEEIVIPTRPDGLPENFPDKLVSVYKLQEIYYSEGNSGGSYAQFNSTAPYQETVDFYRKELSGRFGFKEYNDTGTGISFSFNAPGWAVDINIMDNEGRNSYVEINCYRQ